MWLPSGNHQGLFRDLSIRHIVAPIIPPFHHIFSLFCTAVLNPRKLLFNATTRHSEALDG